MVPPCVYSEGSYWVTADICCGDGGWLCRGARDEVGSRMGEGKRVQASGCSGGAPPPE